MRRAIYPEHLPKPAGVWSPALAVTGARTLVFVSGLTALRKDGTMAEDIADQTRETIEKLKLTLAEAGATLADICSVMVHTTDIGKFDEIHRVRREYFQQDPPTSTMVEVSRLFDPRCKIEITAIAALM